MSYGLQALICIQLDKHAGRWVPIDRIVERMRSTRETISHAANELAGSGLIERAVIDNVICFGVQVNDRSEVLT